MNKLSFFILITLLSISSCKTRDSKSCELFYLSYEKYRNETKIDSAVFYIDKVIHCNKNDFFYKIEKVKYLISVERYKNAILELESINKKDESLEVDFLKSVLLLKVQDENGLNSLENVYKSYKSKSKTLDENSLLYYISLVNFFEGKENANSTINEFKLKYVNDLNINRTLEVIQILVNNSSKEDVLFKITNIN